MTMATAAAAARSIPALPTTAAAATATERGPGLANEADVDAAMTVLAGGGRHALHAFDVDVGAAQLRHGLGEVYLLQAVAALHARPPRRRDGDVARGTAAAAAPSGGIDAVDLADATAVPSVPDLLRAAASDVTVRRDLQQLLHDISLPSVGLMDARTLATRLRAIFVARDRRAFLLHSRVSELVAALSGVEARVAVEGVADTLRCHLVATALHLQAALRQQAAAPSSGDPPPPPLPSLLGDVWDGERVARVAATAVASMGAATITTLAQVRDSVAETAPLNAVLHLLPMQTAPAAAAPPEPQSQPAVPQGAASASSHDVGGSDPAAPPPSAAALVPTPMPIAASSSIARKALRSRRRSLQAAATVGHAGTVVAPTAAGAVDNWVAVPGADDVALVVVDVPAGSALHAALNNSQPTSFVGLGGDWAPATVPGVSLGLAPHPSSDVLAAGRRVAAPSVRARAHGTALPKPRKARGRMRKRFGAALSRMAGAVSQPTAGAMAAVAPSAAAGVGTVDVVTEAAVDESRGPADGEVDASAGADTATGGADATTGDGEGEADGEGDGEGEGEGEGEEGGSDGDGLEDEDDAEGDVDADGGEEEDRSDGGDSEGGVSAAPSKGSAAASDGPYPRATSISMDMVAADEGAATTNGGGGDAPPPAIDADVVMAQTSALAPAATVAPHDPESSVVEASRTPQTRSRMPPTRCGRAMSRADALAREAAIVSFTHGDAVYAHTGRRPGELVQLDEADTPHDGSSSAALPDGFMPSAGTALPMQREPPVTAWTPSSALEKLRHVLPESEVALLAAADPQVTIGARLPGLRLLQYTSHGALGGCGLLRPGDVLLAVAAGASAAEPSTAAAPSAHLHRGTLKELLPAPSPSQSVLWGLGAGSSASAGASDDVPPHLMPALLVHSLSAAFGVPAASSASTSDGGGLLPDLVLQAYSAAFPPHTDVPPLSRLTPSWSVSALRTALASANSSSALDTSSSGGGGEGDEAMGRSPPLAAPRAPSLRLIIARSTAVLAAEAALRGLSPSAAAATPLTGGAATPPGAAAAAAAASLQALIAAAEVSMPGGLETCGIESESLSDANCFAPADDATSQSKPAAAPAAATTSIQQLLSSASPAPATPAPAPAASDGLYLGYAATGDVNVAPAWADFVRTYCPGLSPAPASYALPGDARSHLPPPTSKVRDAVPAVPTGEGVAGSVSYAAVSGGSGAAEPALSAASRSAPASVATSPDAGAVAQRRRWRRMSANAAGTGVVADTVSTGPGGGTTTSDGGGDAALSPLRHGAPLPHHSRRALWSADAQHLVARLAALWRTGQPTSSASASLQPFTAFPDLYTGAGASSFPDTTPHATAPPLEAAAAAVGPGGVAPGGWRPRKRVRAVSAIESRSRSGSMAAHGLLADGAAAEPEAGAGALTAASDAGTAASFAHIPAKGARRTNTSAATAAAAAARRRRLNASVAAAAAAAPAASAPAPVAPAAAASSDGGGEPTLAATSSGDAAMPTAATAAAAPRGSVHHPAASNHGPGSWHGPVGDDGSTVPLLMLSWSHAALMLPSTSGYQAVLTGVTSTGGPGSGRGRYHHSVAAHSRATVHSSTLFGAADISPKDIIIALVRRHVLGGPSLVPHDDSESAAGGQPTGTGDDAGGSSVGPATNSRLGRGALVRVRLRALDTAILRCCLELAGLPIGDAAAPAPASVDASADGSAAAAQASSSSDGDGDIMMASAAHTPPVTPRLDASLLYSYLLTADSDEFVEGSAAAIRAIIADARASGHLPSSTGFPQLTGLDLPTHGAATGSSTASVAPFPCLVSRRTTARDVSELRATEAYANPQPTIVLPRKSPFEWVLCAYALRRRAEANGLRPPAPILAAAAAGESDAVAGMKRRRDGGVNVSADGSTALAAAPSSVAAMTSSGNAAAAASVAPDAAAGSLAPAAKRVKHEGDVGAAASSSSALPSAAEGAPTPTGLLDVGHSLEPLLAAPTHLQSAGRGRTLSLPTPDSALYLPPLTPLPDAPPPSVLMGDAPTALAEATMPLAGFVAHADPGGTSSAGPLTATHSLESRLSDALMAPIASEAGLNLAEAPSSPAPGPGQRFEAGHHHHIDADAALQQRLPEPPLILAPGSARTSSGLLVRQSLPFGLGILREVLGSRLVWPAAAALAALAPVVAMTMDVVLAAGGSGSGASGALRWRRGLGHTAPIPPGVSLIVSPPGAGTPHAQLSGGPAITSVRMLAAGGSLFHLPLIARAILDAHLTLGVASPDVRLRLRQADALPWSSIAGDAFSPLHLAPSLAAIAHALAVTPWGRAVASYLPFSWPISGTASLATDVGGLQPPSLLPLSPPQTTLPLRIPAVALFRWLTQWGGGSVGARALGPKPLAAILSPARSPAAALVAASSQSVLATVAAQISLADVARAYGADRHTAALASATPSSQAAFAAVAHYMRSTRPYVVLVSPPWPAQEDRFPIAPRAECRLLGAMDTLMLAHGQTPLVAHAHMSAPSTTALGDAATHGMADSPSPDAVALAEARRRRVVALIVEAESRGLYLLVTALVSWIQRGDDGTVTVHLPSEAADLAASHDTAAAALLLRLADYADTGCMATALGQRLLHPGAVLQYLVAAAAAGVPMRQPV